MTRQLPAAARAVIVGAVIDAGFDLPGPTALNLAEQVSAALAEAGWTCVPYQRPADPQQAA